MRRDGDGAAVRDVLSLTEQERRVLALVTEGKTNKEIAGALGLSEKTIKNYLSHAFEKLNVTRRAQAAVRFMSDVRYLGATIAPASTADRVSARAPQASGAVVLRDPRLNPPLSGAEPRSA
jgi:DNA-binding CsgD family transcriptional regulator